MPPRKGSFAYERWKESDQCREWIEGRSGSKNPMYGKVHSEETRSLISARRTQRWKEDPSYRDKQSCAQRDSYVRDPTRKERQRNTIISTYAQHPELRQKMSMILKQKHADDPTMRERTRAGNLGKPPRPGTGHCKRHLYTCVDGKLISVQGTFELETCRYLDSLGEIWEYTGSSKPHSFPLENGSSYYPDFYLTRLRMYIDPKGCEVWAGKARMAQREYPGRIVILLGNTYLEQLASLLGYFEVCA